MALFPRVGSQHHAAKLCEDDVRAMRVAKRAGATVDEVWEAHGRSKGVSRSSVEKICLGLTWKHVEP